MNNYIKPTEAGNTYRRSWRVGIENPVNGLPTIHFHEEDATLKADGSFVTEPVSGKLKAAFDPEAEFDMRHPLTDDVIGTASHADVQLVLYSLGRHLQLLRDQEEAE